MYTSRIVGVGFHKGDPLVSFTLASKSIPFREFRVNQEKGRINVFPKTGYEDHPSNQDPEIDNYSCIRTGFFPNEGPYLVVFNGHMCKRTEANLRDGLSPMMALDLTLLDFRGAPHDARIGGISLKDAMGWKKSYLGMHDSDKGEKRVCSYPNERVPTLEETLVFIYDKDTDLEKTYQLPSTLTSAADLAEDLHKNIIGQEILFGVATGVAVMREGRFDLGVYNHPFDESTLQRWQDLSKS